MNSIPAAKAVVDAQRIGRLKPAVPVQVLTGTQDDIVPHAQAKQLAKDWCALGANVYPGPVREVGFAPLTLTEAGETFGDLDPIDCPVRILYGTNDRLVRWPTHYVRMKELLPDAEYVALDGLGHLPMWDDPQLVARRIIEVTAPASVS